MPGAAAFAKKPPTMIDMALDGDGGCQARIGAETLPVTADALEAKLPGLLPDKKADIRLRGGYETVPFRCIGPIIFQLQRLGYRSVGFVAEPPPLDPDIKIQDTPGR